jgi:hypothetical protein
MGAGGRLTKYATPEVARDDANDVDFSYEGAASRFGYYVSSIVRKNSSTILTLLPRLSAVGSYEMNADTRSFVTQGCVTSDGHARRDLVGSLSGDLSALVLEVRVSVSRSARSTGCGTPRRGSGARPPAGSSTVSCGAATDGRSGRPWPWRPSAGAYDGSSVRAGVESLRLARIPGPGPGGVIGVVEFLGREAPVLLGELTARSASSTDSSRTPPNEATAGRPPPSRRLHPPGPPRAPSGASDRAGQIPCRAGSPDRRGDGGGDRRDRRQRGPTEGAQVVAATGRSSGLRSPRWWRWWRRWGPTGPR